jgi:hypothetical protein
MKDSFENVFKRYPIYYAVWKQTDIKVMEAL